MKKKIFFLIIPLSILAIGVWSYLITLIQDSSNKEKNNNNNAFEVMKEVDKNYSDRVSELKRDKYAGEEEYQKAVKKSKITSDFLLGDWEGIGDVSKEKSEMTFSKNELKSKFVGEEPSSVSYKITEDSGIQFLDLKGPYGEKSVKVNFVDENTIRLYFPGTTDNVTLTRKEQNKSENYSIQDKNLNKSENITNNIIPDSSLRWHISKQLGSNQSEITQEQLLDLTYISIDFGVKSLKGIEKAKNLNSFAIDYSVSKDTKVDLVDLSPLAQITSLKQLGISAFVDGDFVTRLSKLKHIEEIDFYDMYFDTLNDIEDILNKGNFPSLKVIELKNTNLQSQDIDYLKELRPDVMIKIGY